MLLTGRVLQKTFLKSASKYETLFQSTPTDVNDLQPIY